MRTPEDLTELWQRTLDAGRTVLPGTSSGARSGLPLSVDVQGFGAVRAIAQGDVMPGPCAIFQVAGEWLAVSQSATQSVRRTQIEFRRRRGVEPVRFVEAPLLLLVTRDQDPGTLFIQYELWLVFGTQFALIKTFETFTEPVVFDGDPLQISAIPRTGTINESETVAGDGAEYEADLTQSGPVGGGGDASFLVTDISFPSPPGVPTVGFIPIPPTGDFPNVYIYDADVEMEIVDSTGTTISGAGVIGSSSIQAGYRLSGGVPIDPSPTTLNVQSDDRGTFTLSGTFANIERIFLRLQSGFPFFAGETVTGSIRYTISNARYNRILRPDEFEVYYDGTDLIVWVKGQKVISKRDGQGTESPLTSDNFFFGINIDPTDLSVIEERTYLEADAIDPVPFGPEPFTELLEFGSPTSSDSCIQSYTFDGNTTNLVGSTSPRQLSTLSISPTGLQQLTSAGTLKENGASQKATSGVICSTSASRKVSVKYSVPGLPSLLALGDNDTVAVVDTGLFVD